MVSFQIYKIYNKRFTSDLEGWRDLQAILKVKLQTSSASQEVKLQALIFHVLKRGGKEQAESDPRFAC